MSIPCLLFIWRSIWLTLLSNSIRALGTNDRRKRRLSGRDQISADGKHLIDGVAFGRPRLRAPKDRPPLDIPPLKRRRITYEEEEHQADESQLLLTARGETNRSGRPARVRVRFDDIDIDGFGDGDDEEDDDFVDDANENTDEDDRDFEDLDRDRDDLPESDMQEELRHLQADNGLPLVGQRPMDFGPLGNVAQLSGHTGSTGLDLETLDKLSALRAAYPTVPVNVCELALLLHGKNLEMGYRRLGLQHEPAMSMDETVLAFNNTLRPRLEEAATAEHGEPGGSVGDSNSEAESVASMIRHYDQHGFPGGSILAGTASNQMVEAMRKAGHPMKVPVHTKFEENSNIPGDRPFSPTSEVDSGSGSDSESDSGPETASSKLPRTLGGAGVIRNKRSPITSDSENNSENDSGICSESGGDDSGSDLGDSDSDDSDDTNGNSDGFSSSESSDEESNGGASGSLDNSASAGQSDDSEPDSSSDEDSSDDNISGTSRSKSPTAQKKTTAAPSRQQGQSVQQSGPMSAATPRSTPRGVTTPVPPGQGKTATQRRNARRRTALKALKAAVRGQSRPESAECTDVFRETGDIDCNDPIAAKKAALLQSLEFLGVPSQEVGVTKAPGKDSISREVSVAKGLIPNTSTASCELNDTTAAATASQQTSTLDVGAGHKMLFAELGLKNPKTKADED